VLVSRVRGLLFLAAVLFVAGGAHAHDLWIVSGRYWLEPFETTRVFVNSGDVYPESLTLVSERRVGAVAVHGPEGVRSLSDFRIDGKSLSFELTARSPGSRVLALSTAPRRVRLRPAEFGVYLEENGLDSIRELREELEEADAPALERYSKFAKAFVDIGDVESMDQDAPWSRIVGHPIEIVPQQNPNRLVSGGQLDVQVLYDSEPLAGAPLRAGKAGTGTEEVILTTDESGNATATFTSDGRWYLRTIHMVRLEDDTEAEWESFWATMTFEVGVTR